MTGWLLRRRVLRTHRGVVALIAVVVGLSAFLAAAAPNWIGHRLDDTLRGTVAAAGPAAQVSARELRDLDPEGFDAEITALRDGAGAQLAPLLGDGRWSASTGARTFATQNGAVVDDGQRPRRIDVRVPSRFDDLVRVVDGRLPAEVTADGPGALVDAVATAEVAEALRLRVGDTVTFEGAAGAGIRLSGIVEAVDAADPQWSDARTALVPDYGLPGGEPRVTTGTLFTSRDLAVPWAAAAGDGFDTEWHVPLVAASLTSSALEPVTAELRRLASGSMWSSGLVPTLEAYPAQRSAAEGVTGFAIASLATLCAALVLLAMRLLAERRADEVELARVRGASDPRIARRLAADAAVVAVPPAVLGAGAAMAVTGGADPRGPLLAAALVAVAVAALPLMALQQARSGGSRPEAGAVRPSARRLTLEAAAVVGAGLGLVLAGTRQPGAGSDPVVALVPVLVAGATGLIVFRTLPAVVRAVLPVARRAGSLTPFLAVARAARAPGHAVLPVIAVLVAISTTTFGATVQASVDRAREVSSWTQVAGDVLVRSDVIRVDLDALTSAPGVDAVAAGYLFRNQRPVDVGTGRTVAVDVLAVDLPAWQEVTGAAPEPVEPAVALSAPAGADGPPAVLTSRVDGLEAGDLLELGLRDTTATVQLAATPLAVPGSGGSATLVLPLDQVAAELPPFPNVVWVAGDVDGDEVATLLGIDPGDVTSRADILATAQRDVVLDTVLDAFRVATVLSAILAATAAVLALAAGDRGRRYGLSVLRTLGLTIRQSAVLTAADVVPLCVLAALAGVVVGTGTGLVTAGAVDLPALSGLLVDDTATVADPGAALVAAAAVLGAVLAAVTVSVIVSRRARLGSVLRAGEPS